MDRNGLIFISCGQHTHGEKALGHAVCELVNKLTPYKPYFAENQSSLEDVTKNILGALDDAVALIAIMHYRGSVIFRDSEVAAPPQRTEHARASVWVEQEIAIAAFIRQVLNRNLEVVAYIQEGIEREGLRDKIHLNAKPFKTNDEVLADLVKFLPNWKLPSRLKVPVNLDIQVQWISGFIGNYLFEFRNNEKEAVFVREIILTYNRILLTEPIKPDLQSPWCMNPGSCSSFGRSIPTPDPEHIFERIGVWLFWCWTCASPLHRDYDRKNTKPTVRLSTRRLLLDKVPGLRL